MQNSNEPPEPKTKLPIVFVATLALLIILAIYAEFTFKPVDVPEVTSEPEIAAVPVTEAENPIIETPSVVYDLEMEFQGFIYEIIGDEICITGYAGGDCEIDIPAVIEGKNVTNIKKYAFAENIDLIAVTIPDSVKMIQAGTFKGCKNLTSVRLPDNFIGIYDEAFYGCAALTDINIPVGVKHIAKNAFDGCDSLQDESFILFNFIKELKSNRTHYEIKDDYVYYTNNAGLCRFGYGGTETVLAQNVHNFLIYDEYIYLSMPAPASRKPSYYGYCSLYRINEDGSNLICISEEFSFNGYYFSDAVRIIDGGIYLFNRYINYDLINKNISVTRANLDGTDRAPAAYKIFNHLFTDFKDGSVYGENFSMEARVQADGSETVTILSLDGWDFVDDEWVYYTTNRLFKMKKDESERIELDGVAKEKCYIVRLDGEWVYYRMDEIFYKIRKDGTGKRVMTADDFHKEPYGGYIDFSNYAYADADSLDADLVFFKKRDGFAATYNVKLPQFAVNGDTAKKKINDFFSQRYSDLNEAADGFMASIETYTEVDASDWHFDFDYFIETSPRYISVIIDRMRDTGGVYPSNESEAYVFDRQTGDKIQLSDIFGTDEETYIYRLCEETYKAMREDDRYWWQREWDGTDEDGVKRVYEKCAHIIRRENFYLDTEGIILIFNYDLTSHVMGPTWVKIPYNCVGDILDDKVR